MKGASGAEGVKAVHAHLGLSDPQSHPSSRAMPTIPTRMWPALALLGFACGLPQPLVDATLATWLTAAGWSAEDIVLFGWVTLPFVLKVLWAPVVDRVVPPFLGRRRGWLLLAQGAIIVGLVILAFSDPGAARWVLVLSAVLVAMAAATQDLVANGYTCDALPAERLPAGAGLWVWGYRAAMPLSSGVAVIVAGEWGWQAAYLIMAAGLVPGLIATLIAPPPLRDEAPLSWGEAVVEPVREFHRRLGGDGLLLLVGFVMCYRLPDGMANLLIPVFQTELSTSLTNLGLTRTIVGIAGAGVGAVIAAWGAIRLGVMPSLWVFGLAQALSNLGYVGLDQHWWGGTAGLVAVMSIDAVCGAAAAAVFVGYLMGFCTARTSATQYALLFAAFGVTPHLLRPLVASLHPVLGYSGFFLATVMVAVPGFWLLWRMQQVVGTHPSPGARSA
jgi:PAT family beta-lactamase induction signal transducer AmpG